MKKFNFFCKVVLLSFALFIGFIMAANCQTVVKDSKGNYTAVIKPKITKEAKNTGNTYTDTKGNVYPVYESAKGKLFYTRISKNGNSYNVYLKL